MAVVGVQVGVYWRLTRSSPIGPALHEDGGSRPRSVSSLLMPVSVVSMCVRKGALAEECERTLQSLQSVSEKHISQSSHTAYHDGVEVCVL